MKFQIIFALALVGSLHSAEKSDKLPVEVNAALSSASTTTLYSLEPMTGPNATGARLHQFKILGRTKLDRNQTVLAVTAFKTAIAHWNGVIANCFDPRHALRVTKAGETYDLLLCYACHNLYVYRGDKLLISLGVTGSPKVLNELLAAANVPLAKSQ